MIQLLVQVAGQPEQRLSWREPNLTIGRAPLNDLPIAADNVSSHHGTIVYTNGRYFYRDLHSTNGSLILRRGKKIFFKGERLEATLEVGDRICLASPENAITVESVLDELSPVDDFESTILAEAEAKPATTVDLEGGALKEDHAALRAAVVLARELASLETTQAIGELLCRTCLEAFPRAQRAIFLLPHESLMFAPAYIEDRAGADADSVATRSRMKSLYTRCLEQHKGFLFLMEENKVQAIATMIAPLDLSETGAVEKDQVILCCPLFHQERCLGFLQVEAPLSAIDRQSLTRRDLSLATLMGHLVAARLNDLETQTARLKLARKATAGFLAATVGHCFKNLLFVPMSLSKMIPICMAQGKMDEVQWMLARNGVNIRYLDILSNEFAAASKDPTEGFEPCILGALLREISEILSQIAPDKMEVALNVPDDLPRVICHGAALKRLILNLTLNSVDAVFGQEKQAKKGLIELAAEYLDGEDEVSILVRDNGPGIPAPILENLRGIYNQVASSADALGELQDIAERVRSTKDQGFKEHYGLGFLFVCQTVHAHQGRLRIESTPGEGASFIIGIPCHRSTQDHGSDHGAEVTHDFESPAERTDA